LAPAGVGIAHVCRRLDRWDEFEDDVGKAHNADNGAWDDAPPALTDGYGTDEDIDLSLLALASFFRAMITHRLHAR
jgi:hypothetical protein